MADWNPRANELFLRAVEIDEPNQRSAFLEAECGGDASLLALLKTMLAAHDANGSFLEAPAAAVTIDRPIAERPGSIIGPYKLLQQIGEGGFGVVFMAEQEKPVRRTVALKIIKAGMDTREVIARFEAERQALALMDHPNIARVLDAGATESGRPYFVMELVKGVPITEFCDRNHMPAKARLKLFIDVCHAIQHAHHKGIIHRDVKPTNVLVTLHDGVPVVKVIDFGVAKATAQKLTERTLFTAFGQMVGTPAYMSPEQAEMSGLDIDTRSDIFSLGVLLYELLTGTTPLEAKRLRSAGYAEMQRLIREEEPPRPSTRLTSLGESATLLAGNRGTDPRQLARLLAGDLDWIVMKALEKDRNRRYGTPGNFAEDVERYLADDLVQARPPSSWYRLRKFARRNKRGLATATLAGVMLLVALGAVAGSIGWLMRDQEARRTKLAGQLELILDEVKKQEVEQKWPEALAAARRAEALVAGGGGDAALEQQVRDVLADLKLVQRLENIWVDLAGRTEGENDEWCNHEYTTAFREYGIDLDQCTEQQAAERLGSRQVAVALAAWLDYWAACRRRMGNETGSRKLLTLAGEIDPDPWRRKVREAMARKDLKALESLADSADLMNQPPPTLYMLGTMLLGAEQPERALEVVRRAQQLHPGDFWINFLLGRILNGQTSQQAQEAVQFYRVTVALRPHQAGAHRRLGSSLYYAGKLDDAIASYRKVIELQPEDPDGYSGLGMALLKQNKLDEAIAAQKKAIQLKPNNPGYHFGLGNALAKQNKLDEAVVCYLKAVELNPNWAAIHHDLGLAFMAQKKPDAAIASYRKAIELEPKYTGAYFDLATALAAQKNHDEAIACYRKALEIEPNYAGAYLNLGIALAAQKNQDESIACYRKAIELSPKYVSAHMNLGLALAGRNRPDEAVECFRKVIELDPTNAGAHNNLGNVLKRHDQLDEAIACYRKSIELDPKVAGVHNNLGLALASQNKLDEAIACYRKAIELDPKYTRSLINLGLTLAAQKKLDEAITCYQTAIELDPNSAVAYFNLGRLVHSRPDLDEAIDCYRRAIEIEPKYASAHYHLGLALAAQKKVDEAIDSFRKAIELDPKLTLAYYNLGAALTAQQKLDEAIACYRTLVELVPKSPRAHSSLGSALAGQQKLDEAIACYRKAIELNPKYAMAHNNLAWLRATCSDPKLREPAEAIAAANKAMELDPNNPLFPSTLGAAYYRSGDWQAAIAAFEKSMELRNGGDSIEWFFLAMAHCQLGDKDKARAWFDRAVQWMDKHQPENEELRRFRAEAAELLQIENTIAQPRQPSQCGSLSKIMRRSNYPGFFIIAANRRSISACGTSSMWVAMVHLWPNGSMSVPDRSP
jgi:eukaryotic-like serine/threonine-protein kinase